MAAFASPVEKYAGGLLDNPIRFIEDNLQQKTWSKQREIINSLADNRLTAVRGCHASSKSFGAAALAVYWLTKYDDGVVRVTAPTQAQATGGIWKEMRKAVEKSKYIDYGEGPGELQWKLGFDNYAEIRAAAKGGRGVRFQALHSGHVLVLADEAPGIDPEIYEAMEGIRAGGDVHIGLFGNPTVPGGPYYDAFTSDRARWNTIHVDGLFTPNFEGLGDTAEEVEKSLLDMPLDEGGPLDDDAWPMLLRRRWVREKLDNWGTLNPRYQARVRGNFPDQAEDALIPLSWLEAAKYRTVERSGRRLDGGIDVAGGGRAEDVAYVLDMGHILDLIVSQSHDVDIATGEIMLGLKPWQRELGQVRYDEIGVGSRLGSILRDNGYDAIGVNVGRPATDTAEFPRLRDELFWELRGLFETGKIAGLLDEDTIAQLAAIRWAPTLDGRIKVESKDDMKARGVKSPDRADALCLGATTSLGGVDDFTPSENLRTRRKMTLRQPRNPLEFNP